VVPWQPSPAEKNARRQYSIKVTAVLLTYLGVFAAGALILRPPVLALAVIGALALVLIVIYLWGLLTIVFVPPGHVLVLKGRRRVGPNDTVVDYRYLDEGATSRMPLVERAHRLDVRLWSLVVPARNALTEDGERIDLDVTALLRVSTSDVAMPFAVAHYLDSDLASAREPARRIIEPVLLARIAELTREDIDEDREHFGFEIEREAEDLLEEIGLKLDSLELSRYATPAQGS